MLPGVDPIDDAPDQSWNVSELLNLTGGEVPSSVSLLLSSLELSDTNVYEL